MSSFQPHTQGAPNAGVLTTIIVATINLSTFATLQLGTLTQCEIANLSVTDSAAFVFTAPQVTPTAIIPATSATAATLARRTIPPGSVLYANLPHGVNFVAAIAVTGTPTLTFTLGKMVD